MSYLKELALNVFEERKEAENRIERGEIYNPHLEDWVEKIIKIFKISNSSENLKSLVWQVKLCSSKREQYGFIMISFEQRDDTTFKNTLVFDSLFYYHEDNEELKDYINNLEIPKELFVDIYEYFKENLSEYFEVTKPDLQHVIIKLKK